MKIEEDMLFAHPVLSSFSDDYVAANFECDFSAETEDENLVVHSDIRIDCDDLLTLIEEGGAGCGYYLTCRRTYFNRIVEAPLGPSTAVFELSNLFGTINIRPVLWSKEERPAWHSDKLHAEYGAAVDIPDASILAIGPEHRFTVDRARLKPFESIFALAADPERAPGEIRVDADGPKITLFTHPDTKSSIEDIRDPKDGQSVLLNALYLPAIMDVMDQIRDDEVVYQEKAWFRVFTAKCDAAGIDFHKGSLFEHAQRLLNSPFQRIDDAKNRLFG